MRASGESTANHIAKEQFEGIERTDQPLGMGDREGPEFRTPKFQRMRIEWRDAAERQIVHDVNDLIQRTLQREFMDCYRVMAEIQDIVRTPLVNTETGERMLDSQGNPMWEMTPSGLPIEDYTRLTTKQVESFLGTITTRLFAWEQTAGRMWTEAMMARAQFEERFAIAYTESGRRTVDDRTAAGNEDAAEERYHAIFRTSLSRRADAMVKSFDRLQVRLKDMMLART